MIGPKIVTFLTLNQSEHSLHATYSKTDRDRPHIFKCVMILRDDLYSGQNVFFSGVLGAITVIPYFGLKMRRNYAKCGMVGISGIVPTTFG